MKILITGAMVLLVNHWSIYCGRIMNCYWLADDQTLAVKKLAVDNSKLSNWNSLNSSMVWML